MFFYLVYISIAKNLLSSEDISAMLEQARNKNAAKHITGVLLYIEGDFLGSYKGGRFIQVLEGKQADVEAAFETIKQDQRHFNIIVISRLATERRNFEDWTMGFKYFDRPSAELEELLSPAHLNVPLNFLRSFYQMNLMA